jgi:hypothetical protein
VFYRIFEVRNTLIFTTQRSSKNGFYKVADIIREEKGLPQGTSSNVAMEGKPYPHPLSPLKLHFEYLLAAALAAVIWVGPGDAPTQKTATDATAAQDRTISA